MPRPTVLASLAGASLLASEPAFAHGFAGPHMFISTLLIDDPNVADEASLPTFSFLPQPNDGGTTPGSMASTSSLTSGSPRTSASRSQTAISGCTPQVRELQAAGRTWSGPEI